MRYGSQVQRHEPQGFSFILEVPQVLWLTSPMSAYKSRVCKWLLTKHRYAGKTKLVVLGGGGRLELMSGDRSNGKWSKCQGVISWVTCTYVQGPCWASKVMQVRTGKISKILNYFFPHGTPQTYLFPQRAWILYEQVSLILLRNWCIQHLEMEVQLKG